MQVHVATGIQLLCYCSVIAWLFIGSMYTQGTAAE